MMVAYHPLVGGELPVSRREGLDSGPCHILKERRPSRYEVVGEVTSVFPFMWEEPPLGRLFAPDPIVLPTDPSEKLTAEHVRAFLASVVAQLPDPRVGWLMVEVRSAWDELDVIPRSACCYVFHYPGDSDVDMSKFWKRWGLPREV